VLTGRCLWNPATGLRGDHAARAPLFKFEFRASAGFFRSAPCCPEREFGAASPRPPCTERGRACGFLDWIAPHWTHQPGRAGL